MTNKLIVFESSEKDNTDTFTGYRTTASPEDATAQWNLGLLQLALGRLDAGWAGYEWRRRTEDFKLRDFGFPEWDGGSLVGKAILLYAEQGVGDEVLFASCIPEVIEGAGWVVIECEPRLEQLFKRSFPQATVVGVKREERGWLNGLGQVDCQCAIGSLPKYLRPTVESFPAENVYLKADGERVGYWRRRLEELGGGTFQ